MTTKKEKFYRYELRVTYRSVSNSMFVIFGLEDTKTYYKVFPATAKKEDIELDVHNTWLEMGKLVTKIEFIKKEKVDMSDKFKTNKFAKKYKKSLDEFKKDYTYGADMAGEDMFDSTLYAWENANQVKSWNRYGVGMQVVSLWSIMVAFILGFVVCAILLSFI